MWPSQQPSASQGLFSPGIPGAPGSSTAPAQSFNMPQPAMAQQPMTTIPDEYTIDESVLKTIWRDVVTIARNVRSVLIPVNWKLGGQPAGLRNADLWGPLIFVLMLSITLSWGEKNSSSVFAMVFAEVALGSLLLTINVILLGGEIAFVQSVCLFGYCLFPLCVAAIVCASTAIKVVRILVILACLAWAGYAAVPFIGNAAPKGRKALAVYPVFLMYVSIAWLALVKSN